MKIASKIRPRDGKPRTHTVHGSRYVFAPTEDAAGEIHFVSEVRNEDHAALFMGNGNFYHFGEGMQPQATLSRGSAEGAPHPNSTPVPPPFDQAVIDEATTLLAGSMSQIGTAVSAVSGPIVVVAALASEKAKATPRKSVVELLERTIEGLRAAGLLGDQP